MSSNKTFDSFKSLLDTWLQLQSTTIGVAVSAAKYKLSNLKKDQERFLKDSIPEEMQAELRSLTDAIKAINREYSTGILSPQNVTDLTKIEILTLLNQKKDKINLLVDQSNVSIIYRIMNLSTEYLSPIIKRKLFLLAEEVVDSEYNKDSGLKLLLGDKIVVINRWKRRYLKMARLSHRKAQLDLFLKNMDSYTLPPKL